MRHACFHCKCRCIPTAKNGVAAQARRREMLSLAGGILISTQSAALAESEQINKADGDSVGEILGFSDKITKLEVDISLRLSIHAMRSAAKRTHA